METLDFRTCSVLVAACLAACGPVAPEPPAPTRAPELIEPHWDQACFPVLGNPPFTEVELFNLASLDSLLATVRYQKPKDRTEIALHYGLTGAPTVPGVLRSDLSSADTEKLRTWTERSARPLDRLLEPLRLRVVIAPGHTGLHVTLALQCVPHAEHGDSLALPLPEGVNHGGRAW